MTAPDHERINFDNIYVQNVRSPLDISFSQSVNTEASIRDYIISEDLLAGQRLNGRMSNVRRFFCLFVTFDFLFTGLMWIICVMLKGEYIVSALVKQVVHYNIHTSLFDVVLVGLCRFVLLLFFYAILYVNHWIIISLSTASTCGFLITKVFYYDWPHSSQPVFEVLLVLTSFILAWGEAWFLDFRVIPQETNANRYLITATESERAPLIRSFMRGLPSMYTESVGNFYSPQGTPQGSLYRFEQTSSAVYPPIRLTREQEEKYRLLAARVLQESWDLYQKKDWKLYKHADNDFVYTRPDSKGKKIFKLLAPVHVAAKYLLDELYYRVQDQPKWNSAVKESHKVQTIDEHTDITYHVGCEPTGGMIASRDFVNLRHWDYVEGRYVISHVKTEHPSLPIYKKIVRGENAVGCTIIEQTDDPSKCTLHWILNVDLKIWLPSGIFDKEMSQMMFRYAKDLRQYISRKREVPREV